MTQQKETGMNTQMGVLEEYQNCLFSSWGNLDYFRKSLSFYPIQLVNLLSAS